MPLMRYFGLRKMFKNTNLQIVDGNWIWRGFKNSYVWLTTCRNRKKHFAVDLNIKFYSIKLYLLISLPAWKPHTPIFISMDFF
jgi:hypothetical protein